MQSCSNNTIQSKQLLPVTFHDNMFQLSFSKWNQASLHSFLHAPIVMSSSQYFLSYSQIQIRII